MSKNVLLIGNGGRETAIAKQLIHAGATIFAPKQNVQLERMAHPSSATVDVLIMAGERSSIWSELDRLIDLVVIGPEQPLTDGIADRFRQLTRCRVFGPGESLAQLEASKEWAKTAMDNVGVPHAKAELRNKQEAIDVIQKLDLEGLQKIVLKFNGLMGGKGVLLPETVDEAVAHVEACYEKRNPEKPLMLFEERLEGIEVSLMTLVDGADYVLLPPAMDYKRAHEGDALNDAMTGGMGVVAPAPILSNDQWEELGQKIVAPIVAWANRDSPGISRHVGFRGCLYFGLMIRPDGSPVVLEINVRMGDPETQAILPLLKGVDTYELFLACANGTLREFVGRERLGKTLPHEGHSVVVTVTSKSYPNAHTGRPILLPKPLLNHVNLVHANTVYGTNDQIYSSGGRVCYVCGYSQDSVEEATERAYTAIGESNLREYGLRCRTDIGSNVPEVTLNL